MFREAHREPEPTSFPDMASLQAHQARQKERKPAGFSDPAFWVVFSAWQTWEAWGTLPRSGGWLEQPPHLVTQVFPRLSRARVQAEQEHRNAATVKAERERKLAELKAKAGM